MLVNAMPMCVSAAQQSPDARWTALAQAVEEDPFDQVSSKFKGEQRENCSTK
jgi:hypothetical protein